MYNIEEKISSPRRQVEVLVRLLCSNILVRLLCSNILVIPVCDARYFTPLQTMCLLRSYIKVVIRNTNLKFFWSCFFHKICSSNSGNARSFAPRKKINGIPSLCLKCLSFSIWLSLVLISRLQMTYHEQSHANAAYESTSFMAKY